MVRWKLTAAATVLCAAYGVWATSSSTVIGSTGPTRTYTTDADFDEGILSGVNHDAPNSNQLQLSESTTTEPFMYVAHTDAGILLKIDTSTGRQVARYHTQLNSDCTVPGCTASPNSTWMPSRTAVDLNGDVWVANRAFSYQGTITKIANNPGDCIDRNGNNQIDTSSDADNDGAVELIPTEFLGQADECIIKSIPVSEPYQYLRALAIEGDGDLWVGTYQHPPRAYEVDGTTGAIKRVINLSSSAYGFVVRGNYLYHASLGQPVERIDISPGANLAGPPGRVVLPSIPNYGIAVDGDGIAWFGDYNGGVRRCDFDAATCVALGGDAHYGVGVDGDGDVWAAAPYSNRIQKYSPSGVLLGMTLTGNNIQPYGIAIGHDGNPWTAGFYGVGKVSKGPAHGAPGAPASTNYSTAFIPGQAPGVNSPFNYTYSDFTGFQARNVTVKQGTWSVVHDGGAAATPWGKLSWNQEAQGATPSGTLIKAEVRVAENVGDLPAQAFVEVSNGGTFPGTGRYVEVKMTLRIIDLDASSPILSDVTIEPSNQPPTALCQDVTVGTGPAACTATASINAGSSDPDGDPLTLSQVPTTFGLGTSAATLTVNDPLGLSSSCSANVTVVDDAPPSIVCPAATTIECTGPTTMFTPAAATGADNCSVAVSNPAAGAFPLGTTTLAYSASDGTNSAACSSAVTVVDTTAPVITSVTNSFSTVWPPNHNMVALNLTVTATDSCAGGSINTSAGACRITNITSNEAINATGDGNTDPDWIIGSGLNGSIRAERKGNGSGRIYTITVVCEDAQGNDSAPMTTQVAVPHSNGKM